MSSRVQLASGLNFSRPVEPSSSKRASPCRVDDWKPLRPVIEVSKSVSAFSSGFTLRISQQPSGSYDQRSSVDRKSVVVGKVVSVRGDLGGRRIIEKKT